MRNNGPVTQREYVLQDGETIVSKTDLQGNITYVNQDFVNVCGYSASELIGAPQNIVRHPDMPAAAFADMWQTLRRGRAWTGLVKNRCKNGDHYWVVANAAPYLEDGRIIGYTSIRVKPARTQVEAAEAAYRTIRRGSRALEIHEGVAQPRSRWHLAARLRGLPLQRLLNGVLGAAAVLSGASLMLALDHQRRPALLLGGLTLALLAGGRYLLGRTALRPWRQLQRDLEQLASGDLTGTIHARGAHDVVQAMQALRVLQINFKLLVGQIQEASASVSVGAAELASGNADLSGRTEAQASSLEQTAASMDELTSTVQHNVERAQQVNQLMAGVARSAGQGGSAVGAVVATMAAIQSSSQRIVEIISVIDGLAFQTNILALNAAVEAARAGEQGWGFAVVAAEVRNLAQRTATAAHDIKALIAASAEAVALGSTRVEDAGRSMALLEQAVTQVERHMLLISSASREQGAVIEQVNAAIAQMDQITQKNAAVCEDAAAAAENMRGRAQQLHALVGHFRLTHQALAQA